MAVIHNQHPNKKVLSVFDVSIKKSKYKSEIQGRYRDGRRRPGLKHGKEALSKDLKCFESARHSAAGGVLHPEHQLVRDPFRGEEQQLPSAGSQSGAAGLLSERRLAS